MRTGNIIARRLFRLNRENAPHYFNCLLNLTRAGVDTKVARALAWWWRVEMGADCSFYGRPIFHRAPGSAIRIGDKCEFRSAHWSNLVGINRPCAISTLRENASLQIGHMCGFSGTVVGCASYIFIGDRTMCGANVTITDTDWHAFDSNERHAGGSGPAAPVIIGEDVWLGMNVTVLKGVEIGSRTVVGAGSVVSRSLPPGVIAAGQPAVVIRSLDRSSLPTVLRA